MFNANKLMIPFSFTNEINFPFEFKNGRQIKHVFHPLDIVDYYSEYPNGDGRYIVLLSRDTIIDSDTFESLSKPVHVYLIDHSNFLTERKM
ncbi:hypothetical protein [Exiguobacterium sp. s189]|uniref:hypothetical protein n=1 Tax=Exiguobacterium sp. s189 TaxID=2751263 RepID=UPI001BE8916D|nr:hypothetical protein [Exiguobacterium sp. s189]